MYCKNCGEEISDDVKFCGKCGKNVLDEKHDVNDTPKLSEITKKLPPVSEIFKRIMTVVLIVIFIISISGVQSSDSNTSGEIFKDILAMLSIISAVASFAMLSKWWKNRKTNKKWFGRGWVIFLIIMSVVNIGTGIFSKALVVARQKAIASVDSWGIYNAPDNSFSVRFPSSPVYNTQSQDTKNGTVKIDTYKQADHTASVLYVVNVSDFPQGVDLTGMLEKSVNLSAKNGAVLTSVQTSIDGYPSFDYLLEFVHPDTISRIKGINILIGYRLYQLMAAYDKSQENILEFDKFINSFKLN